MTKFIAVTCGNPSWSTVASAHLRFARRYAACSSGVRRMSRRSGIGFAFLKPRQHSAGFGEDIAAAELAQQAEQRIAARAETRRDERLELAVHVVPIHRVAGVALCA